MNAAKAEILTFTFGFLVLLVLEWRWRSRLIRLLTVILALGLFWMSRPLPYRELRFAMEREPVTQNLWVPERKATEFESGVFTMYQEVQDDSDGWAPYGALSVGALTWLAFSPVLGRKQDRISAPGATSHAQNPDPSRAA